MHISNLYYNEPIIEAGAKLVKASKMSKAFFTNSGTEAIEGALKAAKKYAYVRDGHADHEIIDHEPFLPWKKYRSTFRDRNCSLQRALRASDGWCEVCGF